MDEKTITVVRNITGNEEKTIPASQLEDYFGWGWTVKGDKAETVATKKAKK